MPIALLVLLAVFGLSWAVTIPLIFAACTITGTLGIVYGVASIWATPTYATNLVQLIGLGIAVDYSLLIVYRFREELASGKEIDDAVVRTMQTAGRAVVFSGIAVALGLALLVAMPLPFIRMLGVAGLPDPDRLDRRRGHPPAGAASASTAAGAPCATGCCAGEPTATRRRASGRASPARSWRGRSCSSSRGTAVLVAMAVPAFWIQLTPGSTFGIPRTSQSVKGFDLLRARGRARRRRARADPRVRRPPGAVLAPPTQAAVKRLVAALERDPEVAKVYTGTGAPFVDSSRTLRAGARRRPPRLRLPAVPGVREAAPQRPHPGGAVPRRRRSVLVGGGPGAGSRLPPPRLHLLRAADRRGARS